MNAVKCCFYFLLAFTLIACGSQGEDPPEAGGTTSQTAGNTDGSPSGQPTSPRPASSNNSWTTETISDTTLGKEPSLAISDGGSVAVAFYAAQFREGMECSELAAGGTSGLPNKYFLPLHYATRTGNDWMVSTAYETLVLSDASPGLDLHFRGETAMISTVVGEPYGLLRYCASNDLGILTPDGDEWAIETVVEESDEAAAIDDPTIAEAAEAANSGFAVGFYATMAFDQNGQPAIVYRDIHNGGLQADDISRADVEMAWKDGGAWKNIMVSQGVGGGQHTGLAFDKENRPVVLFSTPEEKQVGGTSVLGLWIARSSDKGNSWDKIKLYPGKVTSKPDLAMGPDGSLYVAFYDSDPAEQRGQLYRLPPGGNFTEDWEFTKLDKATYRGGQEPSIAIDGNGTVAVAFYRCGRSSESDCSDQTDALVLGYAPETQGVDFKKWEWEYEIVDAGDKGMCGRMASLAFDKSNRAHVAYQCTAKTNDSFQKELRYGRRKEIR